MTVTVKPRTWRASSEKRGRRIANPVSLFSARVFMYMYRAVAAIGLLLEGIVRNACTVSGVCDEILRRRP